MRMNIARFNFLRLFLVLASRSRSNVEYKTQLFTVNMAERLVTDMCVEKGTEQYHWMKLIRSL